MNWWTLARGVKCKWCKKRVDCIFNNAGTAIITMLAKNLNELSFFEF